MDWEGLLKDLFGALFAVQIALFPVQVTMQTFQDKEIQTLIFSISQNLKLKKVNLS